VEADVYVWRCALLVVHARKEEEDERTCVLRCVACRGACGRARVSRPSLRAFRVPQVVQRRHVNLSRLAPTFSEVGCAYGVLVSTARPSSSLHQVDVCTSLVVHGKIIAALSVKGPPHCSTHSASAPSHLPAQQLGTVYLTLHEALNPLTLSKDYLNPFYFQSHTLAFHSQLQHVINLCNAPL